MGLLICCLLLIIGFMMNISNGTGVGLFCAGVCLGVFIMLVTVVAARK